MRSLPSLTQDKHYYLISSFQIRSFFQNARFNKVWDKNQVNLLGVWNVSAVSFNLSVFTKLVLLIHENLTTNLMCLGRGALKIAIHFSHVYKATKNSIVKIISK